jgi:hypothetical protein
MFRMPWDGSVMNLRRLLNSAFAVLVTAGLLLAPLAAAVAAARSDSAVTTDLSMSDDMPCCPSEQNSKGCPDCPLIAMCLLKTAQAGPATAASIPLRHSIRTVHSVLDDVAADGGVRPPPDHPPRRLI